MPVQGMIFQLLPKATLCGIESHTDFRTVNSMNPRKPSLTLATVVLLPMFIAACANTKLSNSQDLMAAAQQQAAEAQKTPEEMIQIAGERINNADHNLRFYSPIHMKQAQDKLVEARKLIQKSQDAGTQSEALAAAILADQLVDVAENNRVVVKQQLAPALAHRDILIELRAPQVLPKAYNKGMNDLDFLIREVEGGNLDKVVKGQPGLLEEFARIEADTLRKTWLTAARLKLEEAEDAKAEHLAPKSYDIAENAIERVDQFIGEHYRDRAGVKQKSREAFVLASQAENVAKEVERLNKKKPEELELYVLDVQSYFEVINRKTGIPELVAQSFYDQSRSIAEVMPEAPYVVATQTTTESVLEVLTVSETNSPTGKVMANAEDTQIASQQAVQSGTTFIREELSPRASADTEVPESQSVEDDRETLVANSELTEETTDLTDQPEVMMSEALKTQTEESQIEENPVDENPVDEVDSQLTNIEKTDVAVSAEEPVAPKPVTDNAETEDSLASLAKTELKAREMTPPASENVDTPFIETVENEVSDASEE